MRYPLLGFALPPMLTLPPALLFVVVVLVQLRLVLALFLVRRSLDWPLYSFMYRHGPADYVSPDPSTLMHSPAALFGTSHRTTPVQGTLGPGPAVLVRSSAPVFRFAFLRNAAGLHALVSLSWRCIEAQRECLRMRIETFH